MDATVIRAANLLRVSEYRLFELAYHHWHQCMAEPQIINLAFRHYLNNAIVPLWTVHFARSVVRAYRAGDFDPAIFGVYPPYEGIPLMWALAFRSPLSVPLGSKRDILIA